MPDDNQHSVKETSAQASSPAGESQQNDSRFLSRWSNRKRSALDETVTGDDEAHALASDAAGLDGQGMLNEHEAGSHDSAVRSGEPVPVDQNADEIVLTDADMPAVDSLGESSDYSDFFSKGVSPELRKKALRHLFSHAVFNQRDGLNDYDEDYTTFEPLGDTITSDMRWHKARKERELAEQEEAEKLRQAELSSDEQTADANESDDAAIEQQSEEQQEMESAEVDTSDTASSDSADSSPPDQSDRDAAAASTDDAVATQGETDSPTQDPTTV